MTHRILIHTLAIAATALAMTACAKAPLVADAATPSSAAAEPAMGAPQATFAFVGPAGQPMGTVAIAEDPAGLTLSIAATGLTPGVHGIHLHETGMCEGPAFASAGKHWNPDSKQHGRDNPAGAHAGDLLNLTADATGSARTTITIAGVSQSAGPMTRADADGTALVIHAKADDYKTDPSGASGDRVACAVVATPR